MAATTAGSVKAYVEGLGLSLSAYRDGAPTDADGTITAAYPHVVVQEGIGLEVDDSGDFGDQSGPAYVTELVQVDLYMRARTLGGASGSTNAESYTLPGQLRKRLHGAKLPAVGLNRVYGCRVVGGRRWPIADNIVRHTVDLQVRRAEGTP